MRILTISAFFPPFVIGGAEICAQNLTEWLTDAGEDMAVLTTAPTPADVAWGVPHHGYKLYRISTPHVYPVFDARGAPEWQKPFWHLQDLFDPRNERLIEKVIEDFRPDLIHIHWLQGIGYNTLKVIARHDIPTAITLHDLSFVCVRTTMFRGDHECASQCLNCRFSANIKRRYVERIPRLGYISPSRANLDRVASLLPIEDVPTYHIPNPNRYPAPTVDYTPSDTVRLLYVGRLDIPKGVDVLLDAVAPLAARYNMTLTMLGTGQEEQRLRKQYGNLPWLTIAGQVPLQTVTNKMAESDLLLVPSLWLENSPGVVFQSLAVGLPVMGSEKGGLPELIQQDINGYLVPPGDVEAWRFSIEGVLSAPEQLITLRRNAIRSSRNFSQDVLAERVRDAYREILSIGTRSERFVSVETQISTEIR